MKSSGTAGQLAEQNKNRLVVEAQENLGALTVDALWLRQILLNLLSKACKWLRVHCAPAGLANPQTEQTGKAQKERNAR